MEPRCSSRQACRSQAFSLTERVSLYPPGKPVGPGKPIYLQRTRPTHAPTLVAILPASTTHKYVYLTHHFRRRHRHDFAPLARISHSVPVHSVRDPRLFRVPLLLSLHRSPVPVLPSAFLLTHNSGLRVLMRLRSATGFTLVGMATGIKPSGTLALESKAGIAIFDRSLTPLSSLHSSRRGMHSRTATFTINGT